MGHRITQFTNQMIETETDQQNHNEPCVFYNFPRPNIHSSVLPPPRNHCNNLNFHHMPEFYGPPPQLSTMHPQQHPTTNLDLAHYAPYLVHDHRIFDRYGRNISFKRKNVEGLNGNFQHNNASSAGPSSSSVPAENDVITLVDGSDPSPEGGSHRSVRNRPSMIGPKNYVAPPVQLPGSNPWLDVHFGANNGDVGNYPWIHAPLPYVHGSVTGACVEGGNMGYQLTVGNRSSNCFVHPCLPQGVHHNPHHPAPYLRGFNNINLPSSSRRISTINRFQDIVDAGPTFMSPVPPAGFRLHWPHQRDILLDSSARPYNLPHLRVLREDEVAILEIPGYHETGESNDQHSDMRLDIDHMSYEELLALGEQIGSVGTGLSEEYIRNNLKITTFTSSLANFNHGEATCVDQQINFCVICQTDYGDGENIGTLDCGHEYHKECVKKWLIMKNTCPVCKSTALGRRPKDL